MGYHGTLLGPNKRKVSFRKTQRRFASSGIEPGVSDLSIADRTLYQLSYRRPELKGVSKEQAVIVYSV